MARFSAGCDGVGSNAGGGRFNEVTPDVPEAAVVAPPLLAFNAANLALTLACNASILAFASPAGAPFERGGGRPAAGGTGGGSLLEASPHLRFRLRSVEPLVDMPGFVLITGRIDSAMNSPNKLSHCTHLLGDTDWKRVWHYFSWSDFRPDANYLGAVGSRGGQTSSFLSIIGV